MEEIYSSKTQLPFTGLQDALSQETELSIATTVRTSNATCSSLLHGYNNWHLLKPFPNV
jgi:hypothetical protein